MGTMTIRTRKGGEYFIQAPKPEKEQEAVDEVKAADKEETEE